MKRICLLIVIVLVGLSSPVTANTVIAHYTVEDGLPSSEIYYVHQDRDGYIWLCTDRGISRFDGYNFTNYTLRDGLACATNFRTYEDADHNLWFTGFDGSITIWDYQEKRFRGFEHNKQLQKGLGVYNWIHTIFFKEDLVQLHGFSGDLRFLYRRDGDGYTYLGIKEVDIKTMANGILENSGQQCLVKVDRTARPWVVPIDYSRDSAMHWNIEELSPIMDKYSQTQDLSEVRQLDGKLYVCTGAGLEVHKKGEPVSRIFEGYGVSCVMVDKENYMWLTTTNDGVYVTTRNAVEELPLELPFLRGEKITAMAIHDNQPVYGTNMGRLVGAKRGNLILQTDGNLDIHALKSWGDDLFVSRDWKVSSSHAIKIGSSNMSSYIFMPVSDTMFLETGSNKYFFESQQGHFTDEVDFRVLDAAMLDSRNVLISDMHNIYYTNVEHLYPRPWLSDTSLRIEQVRRIAVGSKLVLLSTAGNGLYICNKRGDVLSNLGRLEGLASDMVNSCVIDESRNRIWCATNLGVSLVDFQLEHGDIHIRHITNLNRSHGLASSYSIDLVMGTQKLWVASNNAITTVPLKYSHSEVCSPMVVMEEFLCNGEVLTGNNHTLTYKQNDLQLAFTGFSLQRPLNSDFYRYRLVSYESDSTWSSTNQRRISYVNLSPGEYTFEVQSKIQNGDWAVSKLVNFTIEPFFLNRWPVRWVLIALIVTAVGLLIRRRYTQIIAENQRELEFNTMQMKVNQSELDSLRGQMNPHFIFNALKSIQKFILVDDKSKANKLLTRFAKLIRSSLEFSRKDFIPLDQEIDFLTNYLEIEIQRVPDRFSYKINVETSNLDDVSIPSLMLQPICENAIKHAFVEGKGNLEITITRQGNGILLVVIEDDGIGYFNRKTKRPTHQNSLGLEIVESRLALLSDQGFTGRIQIQPVDQKTKKGTRVKLQLPYQ